MKYYKDIEISSLNETFHRTDDVSIKHAQIKYEFERISLAYRELNVFPRKLANYLGINIKFLDLTYNNLRCLKFLSNFPLLHTLVLDRNPRLDSASLPYMSQLKILWLNNCNIINTNDWIRELKFKCPNLNQLSMMCNPVGLTCLNGISPSEEKEYRKEIAKYLPSLDYFDGEPLILDDNPELSKSLQIKYALRKKWQSLWDFQSFKLLENDSDSIHNTSCQNDMKILNN